MCRGASEKCNSYEWKMVVNVIDIICTFNCKHVAANVEAENSRSPQTTTIADKKCIRFFCVHFSSVVVSFVFQFIPMMMMMESNRVCFILFLLALIIAHCTLELN